MDWLVAYESGFVLRDCFHFLQGKRAAKVPNKIRLTG
jgi:hypothetical protein